MIQNKYFSFLEETMILNTPGLYRFANVMQEINFVQNQFQFFVFINFKN